MFFKDYLHLDAALARSDQLQNCCELGSGGGNHHINMIMSICNTIYTADAPWPPSGHQTEASCHAVLRSCDSEFPFLKPDDWKALPGIVATTQPTTRVFISKHVAGRQVQSRLLR